MEKKHIKIIIICLVQPQALLLCWYTGQQSRLGPDCFHKSRENQTTNRPTNVCFWVGGVWDYLVCSHVGAERALRAFRGLKRTRCEDTLKGMRNGCGSAHWVTKRLNDSIGFQRECCDRTHKTHLKQERALRLNELIWQDIWGSLFFTDCRKLQKRESNRSPENELATLSQLKEAMDSRQRDPDLQL